MNAEMVQLATDIVCGVGDDRDGWYGAAEARALADEVLRLAAVQADAERLRGALEQVRENALSWHGDDAAKDRALVVIAFWCDAALAAAAEPEQTP